MSMHCLDCGHELPASAGVPCSECGSTNVTVAPRPGQLSFVGHAPTITMDSIKKELQKNWGLLVILIACDAISTIPAYFLSGWASVAVTVFFIFLSTFLGYLAITRVITITIVTL